jgi:cell wall-associated NlpC family hydrolase
VIEDVPRPGSIGLTSINGPVGFGIRVGQFLCGDGFSPFEHAFLYLGDGLLLEAEPGGARISGLDEYAGREVVFVAPAGLTDEQRAAIVAAARTMVGTPYSFLDFAAIALHRFRIPAPGLKRFIASTKHEICSALVDEIYRRGGFALFSDARWQGYVTPAALWEALR